MSEIQIWCMKVLEHLKTLTGVYSMVWTFKRHTQDVRYTSLCWGICIKGMQTSIGIQMWVYGLLVCSAYKWRRQGMPICPFISLLRRQTQSAWRVSADLIL